MRLSKVSNERYIDKATAEEILRHGRRTWQKPAAGGGGNKTSRVVNFCVHGPSRKIAAADFTPSKLIEVVRVGLPVRELDDLRASLAVPMEKLVPLLGISKATLHRRRALLGRIEHGVYS